MSFPTRPSTRDVSVPPLDRILAGVEALVTEAPVAEAPIADDQNLQPIRRISSARSKHIPFAKDIEVGLAAAQVGGTSKERNPSPSSGSTASTPPCSGSRPSIDGSRPSAEADRPSASLSDSRRTPYTTTNAEDEDVIDVDHETGDAEIEDHEGEHIEAIEQKVGIFRLSDHEDKRIKGQVQNSHIDDSIQYSRVAEQYFGPRTLKSSSSIPSTTSTVSAPQTPLAPIPYTIPPMPFWISLITGKPVLPPPGFLIPAPGTVFGPESTSMLFPSRYPSIEPLTNSTRDQMWMPTEQSTPTDVQKPLPFIHIRGHVYYDNSRQGSRNSSHLLTQEQREQNADLKQLERDFLRRTGYTDHANVGNDAAIGCKFNNWEAGGSSRQPSPYASGCDSWYKIGDNTYSKFNISNKGPITGYGYNDRTLSSPLHEDGESGYFLWHFGSESGKEVGHQREHRGARKQNHQLHLGVKNAQEAGESRQIFLWQKIQQQVNGQRWSNRQSVEREAPEHRAADAPDVGLLKDLDYPWDVDNCPIPVEYRSKCPLVPRI